MEMNHLNIFTASKEIVLGRQAENEVTTIQFPVARWVEEYGNGEFHLWHRRSQDSTAYPVIVAREGDYVFWVVNSTDLQFSGRGEAQLDLVIGEKVVKSEIFKTIVSRSLNADGEMPDPYEPWVTRVEEYAEKAERAVEHYPKIDEDSNEWLVWDAGSEEFVNTGVLAEGISPTVEVTDIEDGHRIAITDAEGQHHFDVMNGEKGDTGVGIMSISKVSTAGLIDTYRITFTDGTTTTFDVTNGEDGSDADVTAENIAAALGYTPADDAEVDTLSQTVSAQSSQIETLDEEKADATDLTAEVTRATEAESALGAQIASLNALGFSVINGEINITFEEEET